MEKRKTRIQLDTCECDFIMEFTFDDNSYEESIVHIYRVCDRHSGYQDQEESIKLALRENRLKNVPTWEEDSNEQEL